MKQCTSCKEEKHYNQFKKGETICKKCVKERCSCGNKKEQFPNNCAPCELKLRGCPTLDIQQYRCFLSSAQLYVSERLYFHEGKAYDAKYKPLIDSGMRRSTLIELEAQNAFMEASEGRPCIYSKATYDLEEIEIRGVKVPVHKDVKAAKATLTHEEFKRALERLN